MRKQALLLLMIWLFATAIRSAYGAGDPMDFLNDGFPKTYSSRNPSMGEDRVWRRIVLEGGPFGYKQDVQLAPQNFLVHPEDGAAAVYTAAGPAMRPGTELDQLEAAYISIKTSVGLEWAKKSFGGELAPADKTMPEGQPNTNSAYFALLLRRGTDFTLLPLNYVENDPKTLILKQGITGLLKSLYDASSDRYLIFRDVDFFTTPSWNARIPSWEHFDAWWLNAKMGAIEHAILPPGPWVADAKLDGLFLRALRNFSCGVDCYRRYRLTKVEGGNIYINVSGSPAAISQDVVGSYRLPYKGTNWEKIASQAGEHH
jgi:hypothetical protein